MKIRDFFWSNALNLSGVFMERKTRIVLLPGLFSGVLIFAACAPMATYHWQLTRPRADADFALDRAECNGYAEQFRRNVSRPEQPGDGKSLSTALAAGSESINAAFAESARINNIYEGCMARLGGTLVPDGPQE